METEWIWHKHGREKNNFESYLQDVRKINELSAVCSTRSSVDFISKISRSILTFRHRASSIQLRHFATLQRKLFIYKEVQI